MKTLRRANSYKNTSKNLCIVSLLKYVSILCFYNTLFFCNDFLTKMKKVATPLVVYKVLELGARSYRNKYGLAQSLILHEMRKNIVLSVNSFKNKGLKEKISTLWSLCSLSGYNNIPSMIAFAKKNLAAPLAHEAIGVLIGSFLSFKTKSTLENAMKTFLGDNFMWKAYLFLRNRTVAGPLLLSLLVNKYPLSSYVFDIFGCIKYPILCDGYYCLLHYVV